MNKPKIVIIGAGTGGTIVSNRLQRKLKDRGEITIIDPSFTHHYQPGVLFSMFNLEPSSANVKDGKELIPKQVNKVEDFVTKVDTENKLVKTKAGDEFAYDYLVLATGARYAFDTVDWWDDSIYEFYTPKGAERVSKALEKFEGGTIVVSIADIPYKCPPAPIEAAMLIEDYFKKKGMRDKVKIIYTSPLTRAFAIETTNTRVEKYLKEKDIEIMTLFNVDEVVTEDRVVYSMENEDVDYDMLIMVPPHRGAEYLIASGISEGQGWIPTDKETLLVRDQENIWALGDGTDIPTSKAGSTAHHQAPVIVNNIVATIDGKPADDLYDGHVQCFFLTEFGKSMFIDFDYSRLPKPTPSRKIWWWFKKFFKPVYYRGVTTGRI